MPADHYALPHDERPVEELGWLVPAHSSVGHYFRGRKGVDLLIAACGRMAKRGEVRKEGMASRCHMCTIMRELHDWPLGPAGFPG